MNFDNVEQALQQAREAVALEEQSAEAHLRLGDALLLAGRVADALEAGTRAEQLAGGEPVTLAQVGGFHTRCGRHEDAHRCHEAAMRLAPKDSRLVYNAASSAVALGRVSQAQELFERVIYLDPDDYDAWQNRSTLRRWTADDNHVEALRFVAAGLAPGHPGQAPIHYALAKELEDLERFDESFAALQQGAAARRQKLSYDVRTDEDALRQVEQVFSQDWFSKAGIGPSDRGPLFILGLPRSGTTLTDRMLSAHSEVASLGELNDLSLAVTRLASDHQDRSSLIEQSSRIEPESLGRAYLDASQGYGIQARYLIDKTPLNYLYLGLIARALPEAKVIHLRRNPMDSCYAIYKTLFRMGYPFSYSLQDVGRYYLAYRRLMDHWQATLGNWICDVDYEALVTEPEVQLRRILTFLELDFEPQCLEFYRQDTPSATASATQVRQPIYRTSVGRWRCFEKQLTPLAGKLQERGIAL